MLESELQNSSGRKHGPRRLEYLPGRYKSITGIESLTTARQLENLEKWLNTPLEKRPVYVKLGCSVSHGEQRLKNPSNSTWAVSVNGDAKIVYLIKDPRSAYKWMNCASRPWNLADRHEAKPEVAKYWIAIVERFHGYHLQPNGSTVKYVTRRKMRRGAFEGKMELLIEGIPGWWEQEGLREKIIRVRSALGELFSGEDGSFWASASQIKPFPQSGFADWSIMEYNREVVADVDKFIEDLAVERVWKKLSLSNMGETISHADDAIVRSILRRIDLSDVSLTELDDLVPHIESLLKIVGGNHQ